GGPRPGEDGHSAPRQRDGRLRHPPRGRSSRLLHRVQPQHDPRRRGHGRHRPDLQHPGGPVSGLAVAIASELAGKVRLGVLVIDGVGVKSEDAALAAEIQAEGAELRARYAGGPSAEVPGAADARALYKALGLEPTKTRPSNEAL